MPDNPYQKCSGVPYGCGGHPLLHACRLDGQVQALELRLCSLRATNLLAADKLAYDVRVLGDRAPENVAAMAAQRRRLNRLRGAVSSLKACPALCSTCSFALPAVHLQHCPAKCALSQGRTGRGGVAR